MKPLDSVPGLEVTQRRALLGLRDVQNQNHHFIDKLRKQNHGGLIAFSTGTTGRPKAIIHDLTLYMRRFETSRPTLKTLNFLLFDHLVYVVFFEYCLFHQSL